MVSGGGGSRSAELDGEANSAYPCFCLRSPDRFLFLLIRDRSIGITGGHEVSVLNIGISMLHVHTEDVLPL